MSSSILLSMTRGYLVVCRGFDQSWQKNYVAKEAERIAVKIRDTFGRFDESSEQSCASVIKAIMKSEPGTAQPRLAKPKRDSQAEYDAWEKRVIAEAKARQERDAWLKSITYF